MQVNGKAVTSLTIKAKVIRANGTVEELGDIVYWHKNPFIRCFRKIKKWLH